MAGRVLRPELLDHLPEGEGTASLRDLTRIHRYLGGDRVVRSVFRSLEPRGARFSVLDAGAASGDTGASVRSAFPAATVVSLDRVPYHMAAAPPPRVAADALALPFPPRSFDYVACSLFLHHFSSEQVVELLAAFLRIARRSVVAIDLHRSALLSCALPALGHSMGWCAVTRHDARLSVEAAFRARELEALAREAGAASVRVRRRLPWFRLSLVASG